MPLGFGTMRLPVIDGDQNRIDFEQFNSMVDAFIDAGNTYFDTSYVYHNSHSEDAVKKAVVDRHPRSSFTIATKFPTFILQEEAQVEPIFEQQLANLGVEYVDYYLLHLLNTIMYNGLDGKGGIVKKARLFEHMQKWKEEGKIRHIGFSFHDTPEVLDQILTDHPEVEFVQIVLNYLDWDSGFVNAKGCYDVIRKHGRKVIVMEPVKGGTLAEVPEVVRERLEKMNPKLDPAGMALDFAVSHDGEIAVLSGMSNLEQVQDNIRTFRELIPMSEDEKNEMLEVARIYKETGPEHMSDFTRYNAVTYHGIPVGNLLEAYNDVLIQPNPGFSCELNYLKALLALQGKTLEDTFPEETVIFEGEDITDQVKKAWDYLIQHSFR